MSQKDEVRPLGFARGNCHVCGAYIDAQTGRAYSGMALCQPCCTFMQTVAPEDREKICELAAHALLDCAPSFIEVVMDASMAMRPEVLARLRPLFTSRKSSKRRPK